MSLLFPTPMSGTAEVRQTMAMRQLCGGRVDGRLPCCGAFVNEVATMEK
ncbi:MULTISPECIES: hypothetical protein [Methylorubrum]|jgi:hypothetical protein|uniref:Uncharacterized protein n=1 Tax=Methylorubrum thiocyanatum TaxID=47958 RepID=A0AA40RZ80_9HYPH|nr:MULTISPECIES: hypothetical protein [Methylorubrum]MBA8911694.1 hypothetical protein [Methylorubrum thiocyanatum]